MTTLNSNLRYRVVAVNGDAARLLSGPCPCYWLDRATNQPLTYKDGSEAKWSNLDEAIDAFVEGKLTVERNESLMDCDDRLCLSVNCRRCNPEGKPSPDGRGYVIALPVK